MGTGTSSGKTASLPMADKIRITKGILSHTPQQNDGAMNQMQRYIDREQDVIDNYQMYVRVGKIKGRNDPWWVGHEQSLAKLKAKMAFMKQERKRLGR